MKTDVCGIGGLGHLAIQFLNKMGYDVTAFASSASKIDMIKNLGAAHVVVSTDEKQMENVKDCFDFIINTIPSDKVFKKFFWMFAKRGNFCSSRSTRFQWRNFGS